MDLIIAIKGEQAFICSLPVVEHADQVAERLELEGAESMEEALSFKRGDTVIDGDDNPYVVADIYAPTQRATPEDWFITTQSGDRLNILDIKGTLIKEVPKYHIDGLLS